MTTKELKPGNKYNATCFDGETCTFLGVIEECSDGSALISVEYRGKCYLASNYQLTADVTQK